MGEKIFEITTIRVHQKDRVEVIQGSVTVHQITTVVRVHMATAVKATLRYILNYYMFKEVVFFS